ncbi:hypothetical protein PVL30_003760 [Lodderomyces elongisporus]|uniref:uncharacterized protein n=1 Tax=Lodderomyces elongisporus TaxID=36914 RepID=UPI00292504B6|nr:uncharacterized protein PVL30_003760 [Lodderomyces elongisporus]WLF79992.1 hypothetical protein PVL30_003760 [Lodderomyces elongisporus]
MSIRSRSSAERLEQYINNLSIKENFLHERKGSSSSSHDPRIYNTDSRPNANPNNSTSTCTGTGSGTGTGTGSGTGTGTGSGTGTGITIPISSLNIRDRERTRSRSKSRSYSQSQSQPQKLLFSRPIFNINESVNDEDVLELEDGFSAEHFRDHPEPQLLASSIGKDHNGKLIPSSSTISLLSLDSSISPKYWIHQQQQQSSSSQQPQQSQSQHQSGDGRIGLVRNNSDNKSYSNIQRLQTYAKLTSPSSSTSANGAEYISIQPSQGFGHLSGTPYSVPNTIPNSPNLDPTSLGGSPSRFWLNSQTPPSMDGQAKRHIFSMQMVNRRESIEQRLNQEARDQDEREDGEDINGNRGNSGNGGSDSPILNPVQTPLEDPPMTPLLLSNQRNDYFGNSCSKGSGKSKECEIEEIKEVKESENDEENEKDDQNRENRMRVESENENENENKVTVHGTSRSYTYRDDDYLRMDWQ